MDSQLSEEHRAKLDGIVQQMTANKEPDDNIKLVVEDFKKKYSGSKPSTVGPPNTTAKPGTPEMAKWVKERNAAGAKYAKQHDSAPETTMQKVGRHALGFGSALAGDVAAAPGAALQTAKGLVYEDPTRFDPEDPLTKTTLKAAKGEPVTGTEMAESVPILGPTLGAVAKGEYGEAGGHLAAFELARRGGKVAGQTPGPKTSTAAIRGVASRTARAVPGVGELADVFKPSAEEIAAKGTKETIQSHKQIVKAVRPAAKDLGFEKGLSDSIPEVKAAEKLTGKTVTDAPAGEAVDVMLENTKAAKKALWAQYEKAVGSGIVADLKKASLEMRKKYGGYSVRLDRMEEDLHVLNAKLQAYYDRYPSQRNATTQAHPHIARLVKEAAETRDIINKTLDSENEGAGPRDLKKRYGALSNLERNLERRRNVAARQSDESLPERMSGIGAAYKGVKGIGKIFAGKVVGGITDIGEAAAGRITAKTMKEAHSTDGLLRKAMKDYSVPPREVNVGTPSGEYPHGPAGPPSVKEGGPAASAGTRVPSAVTVRELNTQLDVLKRQRQSFLTKGPEAAEKVSALESEMKRIMLKIKALGGSVLPDEESNVPAGNPITFTGPDTTFKPVPPRTVNRPGDSFPNDFGP